MAEPIAELLRSAGARSWLRVALAPAAWLSLALLTAGGFVAGVAFWLAFDAGLQATSTNAFCLGCHSMQQISQEFQHTPHAANAAGVTATCADCHVPHDF